MCRREYAHALVGRIEDNGCLIRKDGNGYTQPIVDNNTIRSWTLDKAQIEFDQSRTKPQSNNNTLPITPLFNPVLSRGVFQ